MDDPDLPKAIAHLESTFSRGWTASGRERVRPGKTIDNVRQITDNLRELTEDAKRNPSRLFFGAPPRASQGYPTMTPPASFSRRRALACAAALLSSPAARNPHRQVELSSATGAPRAAAGAGAGRLRSRSTRLRWPARSPAARWCTAESELKYEADFYNEFWFLRRR